MDFSKQISNARVHIELCIRTYTIAQSILKSFAGDSVRLLV